VTLTEILEQLYDAGGRLSFGEPAGDRSLEISDVEDFRSLELKKYVECEPSLRVDRVGKLRGIPKVSVTLTELGRGVAERMREGRINAKTSSLPNPQCPLCDRGVDVIPFFESRSAHGYKCGACGTVLATAEAIAVMDSKPWHEKRWVFSGVTRRASDNGSPVELRPDRLVELAEFARVPATPFEAIDRLMMLLADRVPDIDGVARLNLHEDYPLLFVSGPEQLSRLLQNAADRGYIFSPRTDRGEVPVTLKLEGWRKLDELRRTAPNSDQAFVAMAFTAEMRLIFTEAIAPALDATGYAAFHTDIRPQNEKIDDLIVTEIRRSGLVVADFTGHRGGVYWEAGFAQGLGIPVVRTCRKDDMEMLHFDTRQYPHVEWSTPAELRDRLELHIRATIPGRATAKRRTAT
jgi:hypothetical protein